MLERYVYKNQQKMRCGYTTGTCACAAAKAAAQMLLSGRKTDKVKVMTPSGVSLLLDVEDISMEDTQVSCAVSYTHLDVYKRQVYVIRNGECNVL